MDCMQEQVDIEEVKNNVLTQVLEKLVEENYTPEVIWEVVCKTSLLKCNRKNIAKNITDNIGLHWDESEKSWYKYEGELIEYIKTLPISDTVEVEEIEEIQEIDDISCTENILISIIEEASLKRINLIELEVAVDEKANTTENNELRGSNNNIETIMKNISSLDSNVKQIARNFNRLINCLVKEIGK